jgi:hypothetical protein
VEATPATTPERTSGPTAGPIDPRLVPIIDRIASDPRLSGGEDAPPPGGVSAVLPSVDALCVEVDRGGATPLYVAVDVATVPWDVLAVVTYEPDVDEEPRTLYERADYPNADLCRHVLGGAGLPFPVDASGVEVTGGVDGPQAQAIREALFGAPERFGVERTGAPAILVMPLVGPDDPARPVCLEGTVFLGGPRARVVIGLRRTGSAWQVETVRLEQALRVAPPRPPGAC